MKQFYILLAILTTAFASAPIPYGYYSTGTGTGYTLKIQLRNIIDNVNNSISNEHISTDRGYDALDVLYGSSDLDIYYENDSTILDVYSERPNGPDSYYTYGSHN